jgi:type I restriction enzyme S subunit
MRTGRAFRRVEEVTWKTVSLKEVAPSASADYEPAGGQSVWNLTLDQVESGSGKVLSKTRIDSSQIPTSSQPFDDTNVLYSKLRPYLNKVVLPDEPGVATTELVPLKPDPQRLNRKYLAYFLRSTSFVSFASATVAGAKMPRLVMDAFWKYEVPLPHLAEQSRIVEILDQADELRQKRQTANQKAEKILPAFFHHYFGDPVLNPKNFPTHKFSELLETIDSGNSPKCLNRTATDEEWGILKLGAVTKCEFKGEENKALPDDLEPNPRHEVKVGDVLFSRKNTYDLVAASALVVKTRPKLLLPDLIFRLVPKNPEELLAEYLWSVLIFPSMRKHIQSFASGAAGSMPNISKSSLNSVEVPVPNQSLQRAYALCVQQILDTKFRLKSKTDSLEALFQVLLQRAFDGRLTAKWREGHMKELVQELEIQSKR